MSSFAENLKRIRMERQMSQEEFAKLLHTSKQNISRYESGAVSPKITSAAKFAEILGVSLSELNGEENTVIIDIKKSTKAILNSYVPQTDEARILAKGFDRMPEAERKRAVDMAKLIFAAYADLFKEGNDET